MSALKYTFKDHDLQKKIEQRIYWDKRVSLVDINIEVVHGNVVVRGAVDSKLKKRAALEVVTMTDGVWSVKDHVEILASGSRTDEELHEIIMKELRKMKLEIDEGIFLNVTGGIVTLTGTVRDKNHKAHAASVCWELSGVRDCRNRITLMDFPPDVISAGRAERRIKLSRDEIAI